MYTPIFPALLLGDPSFPPRPNRRPGIIGFSANGADAVKVNTP